MLVVAVVVTACTRPGSEISSGHTIPIAGATAAVASPTTDSVAPVTTDHDPTLDHEGADDRTGDRHVHIDRAVDLDNHCHPHIAE